MTYTVEKSDNLVNEMLMKVQAKTKLKKTDFHSHIKKHKNEKKAIFGLAHENGEKGILKEAEQLLNRTKHKKQDLKKFLKRKRDLLLMQLHINKKGEQIQKLDGKVVHKREKLREVELRIKGDLDVFNNFMDKERLDCRDVIKRAENKTKDKLDILFKLKNMNETKILNQNYNRKLLETIERLLIYKNFINKLSIQGNEETLDEKEESEEVEPELKPELLKKIYRINIPAELSAYLRKRHTADDNFDMDVKNLITCYNRLEEDSLGLIYKSQKNQTQFNVANQRLEQIDRAHEQRKENLLKQKAGLQKGIARLKENVKRFKQDSSNKYNKVDKIYDVLMKKIKDMTGLADKTEPPVLLTLIEDNLLSHLEKIQSIDKELLKKCERVHVEKRKLKAMKEFNEKMVKINEEKKKKVMLKNCVKYKKRRDNFRSYIQKKKEFDNEEDNLNAEEELERRYFN